ncbi:MAG: hypothetical protein H0X40_04525 [Chthoniobacterales bacterium]|nr:hypothetical protein [Chthoniobacterales bacterium]
MLLPEHSSYYNPYFELHRKFEYGFETGVFLPAGYVECLLLRVFPRLYRETGGETDGAQFVALDWRYPAFRLQATPYGSRDAVLPADEDIVQHVAQIGFYGSGERKLADGSTVRCKYIDCDLDRAEEFFRGSYPRPWTISETLRRYKGAIDDDARIHLLAILAGSQDPRGALVLADAMKSPRLGSLAAEKLDTYFVAGCSWDGTETMFIGAEEWLKANRRGLEAKCARL